MIAFNFSLYLIPVSLYYLSVNHFREHKHRPMEPVAFSPQIFPLESSLNISIQLWLLLPVILMLLFLCNCPFNGPYTIQPIAVSWGKAEKVAFVHTTIVTLLHLGRKIEFLDCVCKDKASTHFPLFPFYF